MLFNICVVIVMYLLSLLAGTPVSVFLRHFSPIDRKYAAVLTPWFGITVIMLLCYYGSLFGYSVSNLYFPILLVIFAVFALVLWLRKKHILAAKDASLTVQADILPTYLKYVLGTLAVFTVTTLAFCGAGSLFNDNQFPILLGNNDYILANDIVEYMNTGSIPELGMTPGSLLVESWVKGPQTRYALFAVAFFADALSVSNMTAQYLFTVYIYGLALLAFGFVFEELDMKKGSIALCMALLLLNANYQWMIYNGFSAQLCSVGLFVMIFACFARLTEKPTIIDGIILGLLVLEQAMIYPDLLAFIVFPMCVALVCFAAKKQCTLAHVKMCAVAMLTLGILNPSAYVNAVKMLLFADSAQVGWDISKSFLLRAIGIGNAHVAGQIDLTPEMRTVRAAIEILFSLALLALCFLVLRKQRRLSVGSNPSKGHLLCLASLFFETYIVVYVGIILRYSLYKTYKALISMSFIAIIVVYYTAYLLWQERRCLLRHLAVAVAVLLIVCTGVLFPVQIISIARANSEGTYCNSTYQRKEHTILDAVIACNKDKFFWLGLMPEMWDEHYAIARLEYHGYAWKTLDNNTFWNINSRGNNEIAAAGDIYVGSSVFRDPIYYGDEIILENEVYKIRRITLENPFCVEHAGLTDVCGINRGYDDGGQIKLLDCGRWLEETESSVRYYVREDSTEQLTLEFYNPDQTEHTVTVRCGEIERVETLVPAEVRRITMDVSMHEGTDNIVSFHCDKVLTLMLTDMYFGENAPLRVRLYTLGESIGSNALLRTLYVYANIDQWLKMLMQTCFLQT